MALCTLPTLPEGTCSGIFLLSTFFPPRPSDVRPYYFLLYMVWFFITGILDGYIPESFVMRYMCPKATSEVVSGYGLPYAAGAKSKASVGRFAHIVPGMPRALMEWRGSHYWRLLEGLLGPENFTNFNAQAKLTERDESARKWWAGEDTIPCERLPKVAIVFGEDDPLLRDLKKVLDRTIAKETRSFPSSSTTRIQIKRCRWRNNGKSLKMVFCGLCIGILMGCIPNSMSCKDCCNCGHRMW